MKLKDIILIVLIVILIITLIIMAVLYFNMRKSSKLGVENTLKLADEIFDLNVEVKKLKKDIENLQNGKDIEKHNFLAEIKEIKEEQEQVVIVVDGSDSNAEEDYKGELKLIIDEETKLIGKNEEIDISKLKIGQNISVVHSGTIVTKYDVLTLPFVYEIKVLDK